MDTRTAPAARSDLPSAATVNAHAPTAQPLPPLRTADGLQLHVARWAATAPLRGTVQLVHGLGEHLGRYAELAQRLNALGWQVVAHDHRGHGRSEGRRGALPDSAALLADLAAVLDHTRQHAPAPGPQVLLGHSLGGLVAGRFVAETLAAAPAAWSRGVDALVMSSPALDPGMNAAQKALLAVLGPLAPNLAVGNGLQPAWICSDPAVVQAYVADPWVHDRVTPRLVRFIVDAGALVLARAPLWRTPSLLLWAGADRCVAPAGSQAFADTAPAGAVRSQAFPTLRHEIFNEPDRGAVFGALEAWLQAHFGPA